MKTKLSIAVIALCCAVVWAQEKTYDLAMIRRDFIKIGTNTVIKVKFNTIGRIYPITDRSYETDLHDDQIATSVRSEFPETGKSYFDLVQTNSLRGYDKTYYVFAYVQQAPVSKHGRDYLDPRLLLIGKTKITSIEGSGKYSW
jgi:hypothetical protein